MKSEIRQAVRIKKPDPLQASGVWVLTFTEAGHGSKSRRRDDLNECRFRSQQMPSILSVGASWKGPQLADSGRLLTTQSGHL